MSLDLIAFFSRNNSPRVKDGAYIINLDDKNSKGTHWVSLFIDINLFEIEYISQEVLNKIKGKAITQKISKIQDNESIMCGFCCIAFIEYMLARKIVLDYTNLFSLNDYKRNDRIISKCLQINMVEEASLEFRLRNIDETRNYLLDEIKHNDLISEKYRKTCKYLNYIEYLLTLASTVIGCVSIFEFLNFFSFFSIFQFFKKHLFY